MDHRSFIITYLEESTLQNRSRQEGNGFALIELLVVIAIIAVLIALIGPGWAWGSMILPQMEQGPLYNSINFNLSVAYAAKQYVQHSRVERVYLSVRRCSVARTGLGNPPNPANPGTFNRSQVVDTVVRCNYVGMFGLGEICAASGPDTLARFIPANPPGYCCWNLLS